MVAPISFDNVQDIVQQVNLSSACSKTTFMNALASPWFDMFIR